MKRTLNLVVLIDALGWTLVRESGFLRDVLPHRQPLRTVLGFSSGAIPTLLTGLPPARTGHWNLFYYDPEHSPFRWLRPFRVLPGALLDNRYTRAALTRLGRRVLGLGPLFDCGVKPSLLPWFNWIEKKDIFGANGITGADSIFDILRKELITYRVYSYRDGSDAQLLQQANSDIRNTETQFFFVYLSEMDGFLHHHRSEPQKIQERLGWYEHGLRNLFATALKADPEANIAVISDHGMAPVRRHYDLLGDIESLGLRAPEDYLAVYDSTMARFWFGHDAARNAITQALERVSCGHLLSERELRAMGIWFDDQRYGQAVFLLEPGCMLARSDFNGSSWNPVGMHGYHPDDADSDAIFLSNRTPRQALKTIADIHTWMTDAFSPDCEVSGR